MAKRRRLVAPDKAALDEIDKGFAAKPKGGIAPPIAQVAAESASLNGLAGVGDRVEMARDTADASKWRAMSDKGNALELIAIDAVNADYLQRDRAVVNAEEQAELVQSISAHGLRSPIEVVATEDGYGLISGYRRLLAYRELAQRDEAFRCIAAFVRDHDSSISAYVSMVEENEIRANLTHYERGRISVLSVQQGVFPTVEHAVNILFGAASKAKRSKIRSFASIHEGVGDLLTFPTALSEKLGLQLARALKEGGQPAIRAALGQAVFASEEAEARGLAVILSGIERGSESPKGGRPVEVEYLPARPLSGGGTLTARLSHQRLVLEVCGMDIDMQAAEEALSALYKYIE